MSRGKGKSAVAAAAYRSGEKLTNEWDGMTHDYTRTVSYTHLHINREKIDAIREAVKELEKAGYIVRSRERDEKGRLRGAD